MGRTETVTPESTKVAKEPGRGKRLPSQAKHIIENVRQFFENEKLKGSCLKGCLLLRGRQQPLEPLSVQYTGSMKRSAAYSSQEVCCVTD